MRITKILWKILYIVPESKVTSFFCLNQLSKTQRLFVYYHGCRRKKANLYIQEAGTKNAFVIQKIGKIQLLKFVFFRSTYSVDLQLQFGIAEFKIHPTHTAPDLTGTLASDTHHLIMRTWKKRSKTQIWNLKILIREERARGSRWFYLLEVQPSDEAARNQLSVLQYVDEVSAKCLLTGALNVWAETWKNLQVVHPSLKLIRGWSEVATVSIW